MIKKYRRMIIISTAVVLLPILAGLALWNRLPEQIPTHWNASGEVDGWSGKAFVVFALPGLIAFIHLMCVFTTSLDPKVKDQTSKVVGLVLWICPVISLVLGAGTYAVALGAQVRMASLAIAAVSVIFIVLGNYLPKCKRNYTIGIKIPWTLDSDENWAATHRFAGKVWVIGGILTLIMAFLPWKAIIWVFLPAAVIMGVMPMVYSYIYYKKHGSAE